ncbi:MAG: Hsp33 family molecular chaperone HslO [Ruminococcaceae bacterium]|nr:Hsp33 family molecular chaperone HslO [Oscillospiraceae bacterium]
MSDKLIRAISNDGLVQAVAISSREIVERARQIHKCEPVACAALGRVLTAASMLGNALKVEGGSITLQVKGGGPLGTVLAVGDEFGNVRGYVQNPGLAIMEKYQGKLDVGAAVGTDGSLTVIKDLNMKEPYIGSIALVSGEIAEDLTAYLAESEQIPSAVALGVLVDRDRTVKAAGGYIIQLLPGAGDDVIDKLETGIAAAGNVTSMLDSGMTPLEMLQAVMGELGVEVLEECEVEYKCYCSRDRVTGVLLSLGREELTQLADEQETAEVECRFCDVIYKFTADDIRQLLSEL